MEQSNMKKVLTYSSLSQFQTCRRKSQFRMIDRIAPIGGIDSIPLKLGSCVHDFLEDWHGGQILLSNDKEQTPYIVKATDEYLNKYFPIKADDPATLRARAISSGLINGYVEHYNIEPFTPLEVEQKFQIPITNPDNDKVNPKYELSGKIDGIVKMDGAYIIEHKTASRIDAAYISKLQLDLQIAIYYMAGLAKGYDIQGIIYNVLVKPSASMRQRKDETPEEFLVRIEEAATSPDKFHREIIHLNPKAVKEAQRDIYQLAEAYLDAEHSRTWFKNTNACYSYGRECEYRALCEAGISQGNLSDPLVANKFEKSNPNPELR